MSMSLGRRVAGTVLRQDGRASTPHRHGSRRSSVETVVFSASRRLKCRVQVVVVGGCQTSGGSEAVPPRRHRHDRGGAREWCPPARRRSLKAARHCQLSVGRGRNIDGDAWWSARIR